jgi:hypothetical protein
MRWPLSSCVGGSTVYRSESSLRLRGYIRWAGHELFWHDLRYAWTSKDRRARISQHGTTRCGLPSGGATTCSPMRRKPCSSGCPFLPVVVRSKPPPRCARDHLWRCWGPFEDWSISTLSRVWSSATARLVFQILVTLQGFAQSHLEAPGAAEDAHLRHAGFFANLAGYAGQRLNGPGQREWLDREMGVAMDALAWVAAAQGGAHYAAGLFGAAETLLDRAGYNVPPFMVAGHERAETAARQKLGERVWTVARDDGKRLTRDEALALARADSETYMSPGRPGRRASKRSTNQFPLTPRELEVAYLVGRG